MRAVLSSSLLVRAPHVAVPRQSLEIPKPDLAGLASRPYPGSQRKNGARRDKEFTATIIDQRFSALRRRCVPLTARAL